MKADFTVGNRLGIAAIAGVALGLATAAVNAQVVTETLNLAAYAVSGTTLGAAIPGDNGTISVTYDKSTVSLGSNFEILSGAAAGDGISAASISFKNGGTPVSLTLAGSLGAAGSYNSTTKSFTTFGLATVNSSNPVSFVVDSTTYTFKSVTGANSLQSFKTGTEIWTIAAAPVPEPSAVAGIAGLALVAFGVARKLRK